MWRSSGPSLYAADSRKDSRSSTPTWWSVSTSPQVASRQSTATRCRRLSTSPIASPSMPRPRLRHRCSVPVPMWDWAVRTSRGPTDFAIRQRSIYSVQWRPTASTNRTSSTIRPISTGVPTSCGVSTSSATSRTTTIPSSQRAARRPSARSKT